MIGSREFEETRWDEERNLLSGYLAVETYAGDYPPPVGFWTKRGEDFVIGVDAAQRENVIASFPAMIINRTALVGTRVCLSTRLTEEFMRHSGRNWDAPMSERRRGLLGRMFGAIGR